ncbi:MAG TPA: hypothetical protein VIV15_06435 [Anaerolineales bacterium]
MRHLLLLLLPLSVLLAACAPAAPSIQPQPTESSPTGFVSTPTVDPALIPTLFPNANVGGELTRTDEQGMVVIEVTPINLGTPADSIEFDVVMNTHSVDLSMDVARLSTLTTDTGLTVPAAQWDAPSGGHHLSGKLIFPSVQDGKPILEGAGKLVLTIINLDAPSRLFEWDLK